MLLGTLSRLHRERRRLCFVTALAFLSGYIMYLQSELQVWGLHIAWVTGGIYACVVGAFALLICLFVPSMRFMIEAVAISRLGISVVVFALPELGVRLLADPFITASVIVAGGFLVSRALHGRILKERNYTWRDRILPRFERKPVQIRATAFQARFVGWIDNTVPLRA